MRTTTIPWLLSADAPFHLDYAWQVYKGVLPAAMGGIQAPVAALPNHPVHLAAQHPPLYYAILAPLAGPFMDNGDWPMATALGRLLSMGLGLLSALALAWVAWIVGGKYRRILAIAAPAIAITFVPFAGVAAAVYNDTLVVFTSTVALGLAALIIYRGPRPSYVGVLTVVLLLGMASKVSFVSAFFVAVLSLIGAFVLHGKDTFSKNTGKGIGCGALVSLVVIGGIGWFYYLHNFQASGSLISAQPSSLPPMREYRPFLQVIISQKLWELVPFGLFRRSFHEIGGYTLNQWISISVFVLGMLGSIAWFVKEKAWHIFHKTRRLHLLVATMFTAHFGIVFAQQMVYATGYGSINFRYILPAWFLMGLVLAFGVSVWQFLRGFGAVLVAIAGWVAVINSTVFALSSRTNLPTEHGWVPLLQSGAEQNGFAPVIVPILLLAIVLGLTLIAIALWYATSPRNIKAEASSKRLPDRKGST